MHIWHADCLLFSITAYHHQAHCRAWRITRRILLQSTNDLHNHIHLPLRYFDNMTVPESFKRVSKWSANCWYQRAMSFSATWPFVCSPMPSSGSATYLYNYSYWSIHTTRPKGTFTNQPENSIRLAVWKHPRVLRLLGTSNNSSADQKQYLGSLPQAHLVYVISRLQCAALPWSTKSQTPYRGGDGITAHHAKHHLRWFG